jgi:hypothetical protein
MNSMHSVESAMPHHNPVTETWEAGMAKPTSRDTCILRMTELMRDSRVVTLDRNDFAVYRRNGRELIPVIVPPGK